jgi:hypothetical protein
MAIISLVFLLLAALTVGGIGVSFAYLLPREGLFSHPVPPLSFTDIGVDIGRYLGVAGSLSLYSIRGMGITDASGTPIDTGGPLVGPFFSLLGSTVAKIIVPIRKVEITASGGIFGSYNFDPPLVTGTLDRYLARAGGTTYDSVTSSVGAGGSWAWGWVFGGRIAYFIKGQLGLAVGINYYLGGAALKLSGSYDAFDAGGQVLDDEPLSADLQSARLDYTGLEIILGIEVEL